MTVSLTWPASLPRPQRAGHKLQPRPSMLRSDMDQGAARVRKRSTATMTDVPASFVLTSWQLALFEGWLEHKHMHGAVWFSIDLQGGVGFVAHEARFRDAPETADIGGDHWRVTGTLEVRERPILSGADFDILEDEDPDVLFAAIAAMNLVMTSQLWTS